MEIYHDRGKMTISTPSLLHHVTLPMVSIRQ
jgi:Complex I intermediate-associated protein 30 (CIA30)